MGEAIAAWPDGTIERLRELAATHPDLTLRLLDVPPVAGAVALARARHLAADGASPDDRPTKRS